MRSRLSQKMRKKRKGERKREREKVQRILLSNVEPPRRPGHHSNTREHKDTRQTCTPSKEQSWPLADDDCRGDGRLEIERLLWVVTCRLYWGVLRGGTQPLT